MNKCGRSGRRADRLLLTRLLLKCLSLSLLPCAVGAQSYPSGPIKLVVPYQSGGPVDLIARTLGGKLSISLGTPVIIENRSGAGGNIASGEVAKALPDGLTLLMATNGILVVNQFLYGSLPFNPQKDFTPISQIAELPLALLVNPALPVNTVQELIVYARANPGKLSYASSGPGSGGHLAGALLAQMTQIDLEHVPYRGLSQATTDLVAGHVKVMAGGLFAAKPFIESGKLRALAVVSPQRVKSTPNLPTVAESGLPGFEIVSWFGLVAPAKTPRPIIERLYKATIAALAMPDVQETLFQKAGLEKIANTPEEFAATIARETPQYASIVKTTGAKGE